MPEKNLINAVKKSLSDELHSSEMYHKLSTLYREEALSKKLSDFGRVEAEHAGFWALFLEERGVKTAGKPVNKLRVSFLAYLYRLLGLGLTLKIIEAGERGAIEQYYEILESEGIAEEEKQAIQGILEDEFDHDYEFEEESHFIQIVNHIGSAVSGITYGLLSVLTVSTGLAGAYNDPLRVALGGAVVGFSGALSVLIGTYTSGTAQRQIRLGILSRVKAAAEHAPGAFVRRVRDYTEKQKMSAEMAEALAKEASRNYELLGRLIAEEEYGVRAESLGSPLGAGLYTAFFYLVGAGLPLIPYLTPLPLVFSALLSVIIAASILAIMGFLAAISAGLSARKRMLELILYAIGGSFIIFLIGRLSSMLVERLI